MTSNRFVPALTPWIVESDNFVPNFSAITFCVIFAEIPSSCRCSIAFLIAGVTFWFRAVLTHRWYGLIQNGLEHAKLTQSLDFSLVLKNAS